MTKRFQLSSELYLDLTTVNNVPLLFFQQMGVSMLGLNLEEWENLCKQEAVIRKQQAFDVQLSNSISLYGWTTNEQLFVTCLKSEPTPSFVLMNANEIASLLIYTPLISINFLEANVYVDWQKAIQDGTVNSGYNCPECKGKTTARVLTHGRVKAIIPKQWTCLCSYCGYKANNGCHCHYFDCATCEPDHFCKQCGRLSVYADVSSQVGFCALESVAT